MRCDFLELQKSYFFLVARPLPPPLLVAGPLKKELLFFAAFLTYVQIEMTFIGMLNLYVNQNNSFLGM